MRACSHFRAGSLRSCGSSLTVAGAGHKVMGGVYVGPYYASDYGEVLWVHFAFC